MGGLQQITVNCEEQNVKIEKSPLSTPADVPSAKETQRFRVASLAVRDDGADAPSVMRGLLPFRLPRSALDLLGLFLSAVLLYSVGYREN